MKMTTQIIAAAACALAIAASAATDTRTPEEIYKAEGTNWVSFATASNSQAWCEFIKRKLAETEKTAEHGKSIIMANALMSKLSRDLDGDDAAYGVAKSFVDSMPAAKLAYTSVMQFSMFKSMDHSREDYLFNKILSATNYYSIGSFALCKPTLFYHSFLSAIDDSIAAKLPSGARSAFLSSYVDYGIVRGDFTKTSKWYDPADIEANVLYNGIRYAQPSYYKYSICKEIVDTYLKAGKDAKVIVRYANDLGTKAAYDAAIARLNAISAADEWKVQLVLCTKDVDLLVDTVLSSKYELSAKTITAVIEAINAQKFDYRVKDVIVILKNINSKYTLKLYDDRATWEPVISKVRAMLELRMSQDMY